MFIFTLSKNIAVAIIEGILALIPTSEIIIKIIQNILGKTVKPTFIPKMDFSKGITKEHTTMVVIPSVLADRSKGERACKKNRSILSC